MEVDEARALLGQLRVAPDVILGPFGYAAVMTDATRAFDALRADTPLLQRLRDELVAMTATAAAGGRVYAALLLREVDADAARAALEGMLASEEPCKLFPGGCGGVSWWLGETAGHLLGRPFSNPRRLARLSLEHLEAATEVFELPVEDAGARPRTAFAGAFASVRASRCLRELRPEIERVASADGAAARLYGALLLRALDAEAGAARLLALASVADAVEEHRPSGWPRWVTVAEIARRFLPNEALAGLPPAPPRPPRLWWREIWSRVLDRVLDL